jgi:hypothetical protein
VLGGYLVRVIPSHAGITGRSYEDLERSVRSAGSVEILEGGHPRTLRILEHEDLRKARLALSPLEWERRGARRRRR